jgi:uracil-DNA glycosylase
MRPAPTASDSPKQGMKGRSTMRLTQLLARNLVHPDWRPILEPALATVDRAYLASLMEDPRWLPGPDRLLAAFRRDLSGVRYLLIGESPYPRPESANGIAFYDAAVGDLWSDQGLSKAVNRATSLRNIVKAMLLAEGHIVKDADGKITQQAIAELDKRNMIRSLPELFSKLEHVGFLMFNATPVLHAMRKPDKEAVYWHPFLDALLHGLSDRPVTLVLWGQIAKIVETLPASGRFDKLICEHPYNISFIDNPDMQSLFADLKLLTRQP